MNNSDIETKDQKCIHSCENICIHPLHEKECEGIKKDCNDYELIVISPEFYFQKSINQAYKKGFEDGYKKAESEYNYNKR